MKIFFKQPNGLFVLTIFLLVGAGCSQNINKPVVLTGNTTTLQSSGTTTSEITFAFAEDGSGFAVKRYGVPLAYVSAKDVPVFDNNYEGGPVDPGKDYAFDYSTLDNTDAHKPIYDFSRNQVYFMVFNQTTAASVNADRALFSYNLGKKSFQLIKKEEMSSSFNDVFLSPDNSYLVFSDGSHGGACENINGLIVFDLNKNKEIAKLFLPTNKTGDVTFVKWNGNNDFVYKEEVLKSGVACADVTDKDWVTSEKTFTITQ